MLPGTLPETAEVFFLCAATDFEWQIARSMLWLYRLLFFPALLGVAPFYLLRMRRRGGYGENFSQRFGRGIILPSKCTGVRRIWLQAVSVGEMLAIAPLLEAFSRDPAVEVYLTTTTSTGYALARERYAKLVLAIGYFPLDSVIFSGRAWKAVSPDLVILTEGERWPEHIGQARRRSVPVIAVNARISDRSFKRMKRWHFLVQPLLGGITRVLASSALDAERFIALGFPADRVTTTGSIKLDVTIPPLLSEERAQLRRELGLGPGLVLLGSSTWPGEEAALVATLKAARAVGISVNLLLVPRHAERRAEIETLLKEAGLSFHFRSRGPATGPTDIAVGDTTGELRKFTQLADLVFVGKSLAPHTEGQTPVEAAIVERPILFGPGMSNFRQIAQALVAARAAKVVADSTELKSESIVLLRDEIRRANMATAAREWHAANRGAVGRTLEILHEELAALHD